MDRPGPEPSLFPNNLCPIPTSIPVPVLATGLFFQKPAASPAAPKQPRRWQASCELHPGCGLKLTDALALATCGAKYTKRYRSQGVPGVRAFASAVLLCFVSHEAFFLHTPFPGYEAGRSVPFGAAVRSCHSKAVALGFAVSARSCACCPSVSMWSRACWVLTWWASIPTTTCSLPGSETVLWWLQQGRVG